MLTETEIPVVDENIPAQSHRAFFPSLRWGAIFGGTAAAIGIHILLGSLGVGAGLATYGPVTDANPVADFSVGAAIVWSLCALVSLWFGGFVAGRFSHTVHSGFVHGMLVWSLTLIITMLLLTAGGGIVLGGALKVVDEGLGIGGKAVASGAGVVSQEAVKRGADQLASFIDEAAQSVPTNSAPKAAIRAKREIGFALTKLFAPGNEAGFQDNRAAAIIALSTYTEMSGPDATKEVDEWTASYKNLKAELDKIKDAAAQKARETADQVAANLSRAAIWSFFALLVGLLVASLGGSCGATRAVLHSSSRGLPIV